MKYQVKIVLTEVYTTWVEAENDEAAIDSAEKQFSNGELALEHESFWSEIVDTDDHEEDDK